MQTLAETAWPAITNPLEFITVALGLIVLIALIVQLIRTRSIAPYSGMPALITILVMLTLLMGGAVVDLSQLPAVVATVIGFIVEATSSIFLWPYLIMLMVSGGVRVFNIATYDKAAFFKG